MLHDTPGAQGRAPAKQRAAGDGMLGAQGLHCAPGQQAQPPGSARLARGSTHRPQWVQHCCHDTQGMTERGWIRRLEPPREQGCVGGSVAGSGG